MSYKPTREEALNDYRSALASLVQARVALRIAQNHLDAFEELVDITYKYIPLSDTLYGLKEEEKKKK